jgi:hypothetical protein
MRVNGSIIEGATSLMMRPFLIARLVIGPGAIANGDRALPQLLVALPANFFAMGQKATSLFDNFVGATESVRQRLQAIRSPFRPQIFNRDIAPLDQPVLGQAAPELLDLAGVQRPGTCCAEIDDARRLIARALCPAPPMLLNDLTDRLLPRADDSSFP